MSAAEAFIFVTVFVVVNLFGCDSRPETTTTTTHATPPVATLNATIGGDYTDDWFAVAFSSDSRLLAASSKDGKAYIYDMGVSPPALKVAINQTDDSHNCSDCWFTSLAFSENSSWLAMGSNDYTVRIYDMSNGTAAFFATLHDCADIVHSVQFSRDSALLAVACYDGNAYIYTLADDWLALKANISIDSWFDLAFSPDSRWLATGDLVNGVVQLYDLLAVGPPAPIMTFRPTRMVHFVKFSEDSAWFAVGSNTGTYIYSCDVDTASLPIMSPNATMPPSVFSPAVFSEDSALLAVAGDTPSVFVYEMTESPPTLVASLSVVSDGATTSVIRALEFSRDLRWLAAATTTVISIYEVNSKRVPHVVDFAIV